MRSKGFASHSEPVCCLLLPDYAGEGGVPAPSELSDQLEQAGFSVQSPDTRPVLPQGEAHQVSQMMLPGRQDVQQRIVFAPKWTPWNYIFLGRSKSIASNLPGSVLATR